MEIAPECWNADSTKRPDTNALLLHEIKNLLLIFQNNQDESRKQIIFNQHQQLSNYYLSNSSDLMSKNCTSKIYQFENFPEPKNATEDDDDIYNNPNFHSENQDFEISGNVSKKIRTS
ncbi:hypothetical protein RhiirC2_754011 [Rhizophagus irregularis]|uniref:Serine-threonine/tyrosine-protein kinase catalytic domain-containing protein n=1 Tax=Rhizophagus irregularis TaxID=588596 RepID=A0A2N1MWY3_9GLOM|nr:hypothetical protein RhiirC2_754011 [Rhizophagus irregularis]